MALSLPHKLLPIVIFKSFVNFRQEQNNNHYKNLSKIVEMKSFIVQMYVCEFYNFTRTSFASD